MSQETLPPIVDWIAQNHPKIWDAYNQLGEAAAVAGPLDAKTIRLVKLAIAIGAGRQGAVHSHARRGLKAGLSAAELRQVALLAITTIGWPAAVAALSWVEDVAGAPGTQTSENP
jgi:alkylhydroperoxidase/carboxymuconolactone decarboxylase family protein YurZ